ncbi:hypothetical protein VNO80_01436 [Phaseolus coccineus]|uniref:Uncharacterized protein n=1 Tax=Phaseolus coccineus TaxID=3886 RepID=A0AAN9RSU2_PHACN
MGQALAANCLAISKLRRWKVSAKEEALKAARLSQRVGGLEQEVTGLQKELQRSQEEAKALLTEYSKEALALSDKNAKLQAEEERLKEDLAKKGEELAQKDEQMEKTKEPLTNNASNSYMAGFDDVVAQASGIYPDTDFSQLGLGKVVVHGRLVDEEE